MATGNNLNLRFADANYEEGWIICWENSDSILFMNLGYEPEIVSPQFPGINSYHQPAAFNLLIMTDNFPELYSFVGNTGDQVDIYLADGIFGTDPINLSGDQKINSNPVIYGGRNDPWHSEVIAIWQKQFDGFEALYKSDALYQSYYSILDNSGNTSRLSLKISPCPFQGDMTIEMYLPDSAPVTLDIFDIWGNLIKLIEFTADRAGSQSIVWNPQNDGVSLLEGIYFLKLSQGENSTLQKVVYSKH